MAKSEKAAKSEVVKLEGNVQVDSNMPGSTTFEGTTIGLGVNSVDANVAAAMKAHPHYQNLIAAGKLTIHDKPIETKSKSVEDAVALVEDTHMSPLLDEIEENESRAPVVKAIRDQREKIAPYEKSQS